MINSVRSTSPLSSVLHSRRLLIKTPQNSAPRSSKWSVYAAVEARPVGNKPPFPFVCLSGQEDLKLALLLNVVDPTIGGVLIMGDRGTGKSIAVRALAQLLPEMEVVEGDVFNSHPTDVSLMSPQALEMKNNGVELITTMMKTPLVELPLGATEDRICGTIDIERALSEGVRAFDPGLLAKANRGILYVDEVNLLEDGIVDVVLDSAASGMNTVEREGVSIVHPARFIMIGSGHPEEGELRPQLIDRFGLSVQITTVMDRELRKKIVLDRLSYESDPDAFVALHEAEEEEIRMKLIQARDRVHEINLPEDIKLAVAKICGRLKIEGLRGDIVACRASKALVALEGGQEVTLDDIERVICLALTHRMRKDPLDPIDTGSKVKLAFKKVTDPKFKEPKEESASADNEERKPGSWKGLNS
eukprot:g1545.t1